MLDILKDVQISTLGINFQEMKEDEEYVQFPPSSSVFSFTSPPSTCFSVSLTSSSSSPFLLCFFATTFINSLSLGEYSIPTFGELSANVVIPFGFPFSVVDIMVQKEEVGRNKRRKRKGKKKKEEKKEKTDDQHCSILTRCLDGSQS